MLWHASLQPLVAHGRGWDPGPQPHHLLIELSAVQCPWTLLQQPAFPAEQQREVERQRCPFTTLSAR